VDGPENREDDECLGQPVAICTPDMIERVWELSNDSLDDGRVTLN
jgi:hypothetical protein